MWTQRADGHVHTATIHGQKARIVARNLSGFGGWYVLVGHRYLMEDPGMYSAKEHFALIGMESEAKRAAAEFAERVSQGMA